MQAGGTPSSNIIISATPPADTSKLWFRKSGTPTMSPYTTYNGIYCFDSNLDEWVSETFNIEFADNGNLANNNFPRFGDSSCTASNGVRYSEQLLVYGVTIHDGNNRSGSLRVWSSIGTPASAFVLVTIPFDGTVDRTSFVPATPVIQPAKNTMSLSPFALSGNMNDAKFVLQVKAFVTP